MTKATPGVLCQTPEDVVSVVFTAHRVESFSSEPRKTSSAADLNHQGTKKTKPGGGVKSLMGKLSGSQGSFRSAQMGPS